MPELIRSAGKFAGGGPVQGWRAAFPPAQWLATYQPQWVTQDAIAGVTLAAYGIPVSLAYASLAGLPLTGSGNSCRCLPRESPL